MSPKPDPRDRIPIFRERQPRVANMLYQMGLCLGTFFLLITIGRYGPESEVPDRVERICLNGPIEDEFELGFLGVYLRADSCARIILTGRIGRHAPFHGLPFNNNIYCSCHPLPYRHYQAKLPQSE
jgi:hypothetical protein